MATATGKRTCEPCRNGCEKINHYRDTGHGPKPVTNGEVCASRLTRCHHRRTHNKPA